MGDGAKPFPTANIYVDGVANGVYLAVSVVPEGYGAVVFVTDGLAEVYLIGFSGDLYGRYIALELDRVIPLDFIYEFMGRFFPVGTNGIIWPHRIAV